jgi:hypothetical protein
MSRLIGKHGFIAYCSQFPDRRNFERYVLLLTLNLLLACSNDAETSVLRAGSLGSSYDVVGSGGAHLATATGGTGAAGGARFGVGGDSGSIGGIDTSGGSYDRVWSGGFTSTLSNDSGGTTLSAGYAGATSTTSGGADTGGAPASGGQQTSGGAQSTGGRTLVGGAATIDTQFTGLGGTVASGGATSFALTGVNLGGASATGGCPAATGGTDAVARGIGGNSDASLDAGEPVQTFFVAPDTGDDSAAGTEENPFRTIGRARDAIRLLGDERIGPVTVFLRGGRHVLKSPLEFEAVDSGSAEAPVTYQAYPTEFPVLSGGMSITNWTVDAQGRWAATVPQGARFRQLYVGGRRAQRARGTVPELNGDWGSVSTWPNPSPAGYFTPSLSFGAWRNPTDVEFGYYGEWNHIICSLGNLNSYDSGQEALIQVAMSQPCYFLGLHAEGSPIIGNPDYVENAVELLDEPGEWYHDRVTNTLYYLPLQGEKPGSTEAIVPLLERLLVVQGSLDAPVHDLVFRGLTFAHATWLRPSTEGHVDVQANFTIDPDPTHDFWRNGSLVTVHNQYLKSPAAILVSIGQAISFDRCTFTQLGSAALDLADGSRSNRVVGSRFFDVSGNGIQVGDVLEEDHHPTDPRLIVKDNEIANNYFHDLGQDYTGSVGIFVGYTNGTVIEHNEIEDLPYTGISLGWGWGEEDVGGGGSPQPFNYATPTTAENNRVEFNHIHHVMQQRHDGSAIYTLGAQPNTIIRANDLHDIPRASGIYLDQGSASIEVTENLVYRVLLPLELNNYYQARNSTCSIHDNSFDQNSDPAALASAVANAGIQSEYQDILPGN